MSTEIIAHRGASRFAPENTMPAFELAHELGAEGIETDVQLTKDNVPVLIHDEHVKRTTNGKGYIKDFTMNQLKQLDAGAWFSSGFKGTEIITLEEFLHWIKPKSLSLNIELKNNKVEYKNMESIVYEMLAHFQLQSRTTISTFNSKSVRRMKSLQQHIEIAYLTSRRKKNLARFAKELGADAVHIKYRLLNRKLMEQCQQENIRVRVYTINRLKQMLHCYRRKCDGIFTDIPDKALNIRKI